MLEGLPRSALLLIALTLLTAVGNAAPPAEIQQWRNHLLTSNDAEIRNIAALALLSVDDPAAFRVLVETLRDEEKLPARLSILRAMAIKRDERLLPHVIPLLADPQDKIPPAAADALAAQRSPGAVRTIINALENPNLEIRRRAQIAGVLAQMRELKAVEPLIDLLTCDEEALRRAALHALQKLTLCSFGYDQEPWRAWWAARKDQPREALLEDIIQRQSAQIEMLNRTVGRLWRRVLDSRNDPKDPAPVYDALASSFPAVQVYALSLLGELKPEGWEERVIGLRNDPNREVRAALAEALGRANDEKAVEALVAMLDDTDREVVVKAARSLGRLKARQALPALARVFGGESGQTAVAAVEAIGEIGSPAAAPILGGVLTDAKAPRAVREEAALALGKIIAPESLHYLVKVLDAPEERIRWSATDALGRLGLKQGIDPLGSVLKNDKNADVRQVAALSLERIGGPETIPPLLAGMDDPEKTVADQSAAALVSVTGPESIKQAAFIADLAEQGKHKKVVRLANRILETSETANGQTDDLREVQRLLGESLIKLERWDEAAQVYAKLVAAKPETGIYHHGLLTAHARLNHRGKLLAAAQVAFEHAPEKAADWFPLIKPALEAVARSGEHAALIAFADKVPPKALGALPKEERAWLAAQKAQSEAARKRDAAMEQTRRIERLAADLAVPEKREKALEQLKAIGEPALPTLVQLLRDTDDATRQDMLVGLLEAITKRPFNIKGDTAAEKRAELIKAWVEADTPKPTPTDGNGG